MADEQSPGGVPGAAHVSNVLLQNLQRVLAAHSGPGLDDGEVSRALHAIGVEARAKGIRAEQLVVSLKAVFASLAPTEGSPGTSQAERAKRLAYFVTTCVREYYAPGPGEPPASEGPQGS